MSTIERRADEARSAQAVASPARWLVLGAFAIVYLVWGSTYLAILFALETLPPFAMAAARFLVAGGAMYAFARLFGGAAAPTRAEWRTTAIVGVLLLVFGNGLVVWSELRVASGVAALIVGVVPCCMVLVDWLRPNGTRPGARVAMGLVLGLAGLFVLIGPDVLMGGGRADYIGVAALVTASLTWAVGSIYSRHAPMPRSAVLATAMEMLVASAGLAILALLHGDFTTRAAAAPISLVSIAGWLYLVVFGSVVAFTAYVWLLRASTPARVSTYAYVNPVVAVFLGFAIAGEPLTTRMIIAAAVIVSGVVLITLAPKRPSTEPPHGTTGPQRGADLR
jgi:drug/metabolite transporter (DMT)-like permease